MPAQCLNPRVRERGQAHWARSVKVFFFFRKQTLEEGAHFVLGRSGMTVDPRISTMSGRSTSGFRRSGRHRVRAGGGGRLVCTASIFRASVLSSRLPYVRRRQTSPLILRLRYSANDIEI